MLICLFLLCFVSLGVVLLSAFGFYMLYFFFLRKNLKFGGCGEYLQGLGGEKV